MQTDADKRLFLPTASYLVVETAAGSSDSPAVHASLLLVLPTHTVLGPCGPEELTQVCPVSVSPPLVELERKKTKKHGDI